MQSSGETRYRCAIHSVWSGCGRARIRQVSTGHLYFNFRVCHRIKKRGGAKAEWRDSLPLCCAQRMERMRSSPHPASVHRTLAFKSSSLLFGLKKKEMLRISFFFNPSGETRTRGILVPNQAPYQLGHTRITDMYYTLSGCKMQLKSCAFACCLFCNLCYNEEKGGIL